MLWLLRLMWRRCPCDSERLAPMKPRLRLCWVVVHWQWPCVITSELSIELLDWIELCRIVAVVIRHCCLLVVAVDGVVVVVVIDVVAIAVVVIVKREKTRKNRWLPYDGSPQNPEIQSRYDEVQVHLEARVVWVEAWATTLSQSLGRTERRRDKTLVHGIAPHTTNVACCCRTVTVCHCWTAHPHCQRRSRATVSSNASSGPVPLSVRLRRKNEKEQETRSRYDELALLPTRSEK